MNYIIKNNFLEAVFQSKGAELISLKFQKNELIWTASEPWKRHAPVLFPTVGKLKDDSFIYQNQKYTLPQHGFARDTEWICTFQNSDTIEFELTDNEETYKIYPFHFSFLIKYQLINSAIHIYFQIFNPYHYPMYFSVGYHPAFYLPFQLFNYKLKFYPHQNHLVRSVLNQGLINSEKKHINLHHSTLELNTELFDNDAIVLENTNIENLALFCDEQNYSIKIYTGKCRNIGIWTKSNCEDFVCIEPWMGIADYENTTQVLGQKKDIITLPAYQSYNWSVIIEIKNK